MADGGFQNEIGVMQLSFDGTFSRAIRTRSVSEALHQLSPDLADASGSDAQYSPLSLALKEFSHHPLA